MLIIIIIIVYFGILHNIKVSIEVAWVRRACGEVDANQLP